MNALLVIEQTHATSELLRVILTGSDWTVHRASPQEGANASLELAALIVVVDEPVLTDSADLLAQLARQIRAPIVVAGRGNRLVEATALHDGAAAYCDLHEPAELVVARLEALLRRHPFGCFSSSSRRVWAPTSDGSCIASWPIGGHSDAQTPCASSGAVSQARARTASGSTGSARSWLVPASIWRRVPVSARASANAPRALLRSTAQRGKEGIGAAYSADQPRNARAPGSDRLPGARTGPGALPGHVLEMASVTAAAPIGPDPQQQLSAARGGAPPGGGPPRRHGGGYPYREGLPMKRLIVSLALISVVVAGAAFAATFNINGNSGQENQQDIGAAAAAVEFCNHNVEANIDGVFVDGSGYMVADVEVDANETCAGWTVSVTLTDINGNSLGESSAPLNAAGDAILGFGSTIAVADVEGLHIQIDNNPGQIVP